VVCSATLTHNDNRQLLPFITLMQCPVENPGEVFREITYSNVCGAEKPQIYTHVRSSFSQDEESPNQSALRR
jgi:hypothetical protein